MTHLKWTLFPLLLAAYCLSPLVAQETATVSDEGEVQTKVQTKEQTQSAQDKKQADKADRKKNKPEPVFNPSEEISEDSPVPFPVDI